MTREKVSKVLLCTVDQFRSLRNGLQSVVSRLIHNLMHGDGTIHNTLIIMTTRTITVGVLALQGAFIEHIHLLRQAAEALEDLRSPSRDQPSQAALAYHSADDSESAADGGDHASHTITQQSTIVDNDGSSSLHPASANVTCPSNYHFTFPQIRTPAELAACDALIIPGGESTSISLIAARTGLLEPLRQFVKVARRPTWGTCAGLILLAERADQSKVTGQDLIGGLDVRVRRNFFGRQVESFEAEVQMPGVLGEGEGFGAVFIRAPVVEEVLTPSANTTSPVDESGSAAGEMPLAAPTNDAVGVVVAPAKQATNAQVEILGRLPGRAKAIKDRTTTAAELGEEGDIVAVKQGNVFGTAFHPELTQDARIHQWWLRQVVEAVQADERQAR